MARSTVPLWLDLSRIAGDTLPHDLLPDLLMGPLLVGVVGLDLRGQAVGSEGAKAIAATDQLRALQVLRLSNAQLDEAGVRAIAYAQNLQALVFLDLSGNPGSPLGTSELSKAAWVPHLVHLDLRNTPPPTVDAARTLGERLVRVEVLHVDGAWPTAVLDALREGLGDRVGALVVESPPTE